MDVSGPELWWIIPSLCIALLLSSLESSIVSTALVSIAADFNNFQQSNWIVIAYLLTYSSFLIIFARLSDVTGRKAALLTGLCIFGIASLACGLAKSMLQLIVFRAFQGIGGSGIYALAMVIVADISPRQHLGTISGMINSVFVLASAIGPLVGGAIATYTTWRWCFYFNVPGAAVVMAVISYMYPKEASRPTLTLRELSRRVDWLGLILCLAASIVIIVPIQEGGTAYDWSNVLTIILLAIGSFCWAAFACWETWLARSTGERVLLPMVPHQAIMHRIVGACIVNSFLTGIVFTSIIIYLPQRFQAVNGLTPVKAGERILPVLLVSAFGATFAGVALSKKNFCSYFIIAAAALQALGLGLHSSLPTSLDVPGIAYLYQAILGMGTGVALSATFTLARIEIPRKQDIAAMVGCITHLRVFGGVVGVVICRVTQDAYVIANLSKALSPGVVKQLMSSLTTISGLPESEALVVRSIYGESFNLQFRILTYIAAANFVVALFTLRRVPLKEPASWKGVDQKHASLAAPNETATENIELAETLRAERDGDGPAATKEPPR